MPAGIRPGPVCALCLSGGGIRSATFNLGVIQAFAEAGLLGKFEYLSTVSGGGYIGSWLSAWIRRRIDRSVPGPRCSTITNEARDAARAFVFNALKSTSCAPAVEGQGHRPRACSSPLQPEAAPIAHLRDYSNYLSPQLGLLSADTWTLVATFCRNLLLNWLVLLPLLAGVLMIPRLFMLLITALLHGCNDDERQHGCTLFALIVLIAVIGGLLEALGIGYMDSRRPGLRRERGCRCRRSELDQQGQFLRRCWTPILVGSVVLTAVWIVLNPYFGTCRALVHTEWCNTTLNWVPPLSRDKPFDGLLPVLIGIKIVIGLAGWLIGLLWNSNLPRGVRQRGRGALVNVGQGVIVIVAGVVSGWLLWLIFTATWFNPGFHPRLYACFAVPLYLLTFVLSGALLHGLLSPWADAQNLEWSARAGAWLLIAIVGWIALFALVLYGPSLLACINSIALRSLTLSAGGLAGIATALLGKSSKTPATRDESNRIAIPKPSREVFLAIAAPLFVVLLVVSLAWITDALLPLLPLASYTQSDEVSRALWSPGAHGLSLAGDWHLRVLLFTPWAQVWLWLGIFVAITTIAGLFINVNKFSLHAVYRNRLVRAYMGASHSDRCPSLFTGFDPDDDLPVHELRGQVPLHIINVTLNLVSGERLAWQQRKAESFTISPFHCGSTARGYRSARLYGGGYGLSGWGTYWVRPERAVSLGTAIAISGAAANPNMGYHSSPVITFLMTLFNVRLGAWLGNPGRAGEGGDTYRNAPTWGRAFPRIANRPIVEEAFGLTDEKNPYVNLSDGGHFENLGIYEMVRRRCRCIVASDAGQDEHCIFEDLGNAVRKIYIDMGIEIRFQGRVPIYPREPKRDQPGGSYCDIATICYKQVDDPDHTRPYVQDGVLLYIKAAFYGNEPIDVYNYAQGCADFPHQTTANQFFTESQFESYRRLGYYIVRTIYGQPDGQDSRDQQNPQGQRGQHGQHGQQEQQEQQEQQNKEDPCPDLMQRPRYWIEKMRKEEKGKSCQARAQQGCGP